MSRHCRPTCVHLHYITIDHQHTINQLTSKQMETVFGTWDKWQPRLEFEYACTCNKTSEWYVYIKGNDVLD